MAKARNLEQCDPADERRENARNDLIGKHVLDVLGKPGDLLLIQVRPLWDRRYRVNIVVGTNVTSARVANSFFLEADEDGTVIASTPRIKKQYVRAPEKQDPPAPAAQPALA